jgi:hypothetical protein
MSEQVYEPAANNLALSALVALIPIVVLSVMLAVFSIPAHCRMPQPTRGCRRAGHRFWRGPQLEVLALRHPRAPEGERLGAG